MATELPGKITSPANPFVKYARKLQRRRVREKEGRCLVEGVRLVDDVHDAGAFLSMVFWEPVLRQQPGGEALLARLEGRRPPGGLYEVTPKIIEHLADTDTPQGVVGVAERPVAGPHDLLGDLSDRPATIVVLDRVRDPGNVGTVVRSADASGAAGVIFLPGTADPFSPKALRASMGSAFHFPVLAGEDVVRAYRASGEARANGSRSETAAHLPEHLRRLGFDLFVADPAAELPHWRARMGGRAAIIVGNETEGPDPSLWEEAQWVSIPMLGRAESLNVAVAASILLYEAARRRESW